MFHVALFSFGRDDYITNKGPPCTYMNSEGDMDPFVFKYLVVFDYEKECTAVELEN